MMSSLPSSLDIATKVNVINRQLSLKDKERLAYLAEILINEANKDKSLIVLLDDLRHKYCHEKDDSRDILRILLELAELEKHADSLRPPNQIRPPKLEDYRYITDEKCRLVSMRSCLIKLVSSLRSNNSLRTFLETLCHKSDSNPENYTCIFVLLRELEQKAKISPGRLEFIYEILENDDQFANVRNILVDYQEQFCNDERRRRSSAGNNPPVHVDMSCPPSNQLPRQPLHPGGSHSLRAPLPPPFAQQPPSVPHGLPHGLPHGVPPPHQMRGGLIHRQISAPSYNHQNSPCSQSNRLYQSDSFQRPVPPMNQSPDLQRNQFVQPSRQNQYSYFPNIDPQTNHHSPNQYSNPPAPHQTNQYYRQQPGQYYRPPNQQSGQYYRPPNQQSDHNNHPLAQPQDQSHFTSDPSFASSPLVSPAAPYTQYHPPVLPPGQRYPHQQTEESLSTRWLQQPVRVSSQQQQQVIGQSMNAAPPPPPAFNGQMSQSDSYGVGRQLECSWPNQPAGPTVQFSSSVVGTHNNRPAIRSRQNSEPAGNSPLKRNPPPKKSHTLPENFSHSPQTPSSIHHVPVPQFNSGSPATPAESLVIPHHRNPSSNSPGHSVNVSVYAVSRQTPSPGAQAASFSSYISAPYDVEPCQVQEMRRINEENHM